MNDIIAKVDYIEGEIYRCKSTYLMVTILVWTRHVCRVQHVGCSEAMFCVRANSIHFNHRVRLRFDVQSAHSQPFSPERGCLQ